MADTDSTIITWTVRNLKQKQTRKPHTTETHHIHTYFNNQTEECINQKISIKTSLIRKENGDEN